MACHQSLTNLKQILVYKKLKNKETKRLSVRQMPPSLSPYLLPVNFKGHFAFMTDK